MNLVGFFESLEDLGDIGDFEAPPLVPAQCAKEWLALWHKANNLSASDCLERIAQKYRVSSAILAREILHDPACAKDVAEWSIIKSSLTPLLEDSI